MDNEKLIFCGNNKELLPEELIAKSNESNGGWAFRIPSLINSNGTLIAAINKSDCGSDWGYIERHSDNRLPSCKRNHVQQQLLFIRISY